MMLPEYHLDMVRPGIILYGHYPSDDVDKSKVNVKLSEEHSDYKWVSKDSDYLDEFIKDKLSNI